MSGSRRAWVDESIRTQGVPTPTYLLGAALTTPAEEPTVSNELTRLAPAGRKLHWHDLGRDGKADVVRLLAALGLRSLVVIATPMVNIRQEYARGTCVDRLLRELSDRGVEQVTFESRSASQDKKDQRRVDGLRNDHAIRPSLRVEWAVGANEPLLWAPDLILGAVGDAKASREPLRDDIAGLVTEIDVTLQEA